MAHTSPPLSLKNFFAPLLFCSSAAYFVFSFLARAKRQFFRKIKLTAITQKNKSLLHNMLAAWLVVLARTDPTLKIGQLLYSTASFAVKNCSHYLALLALAASLRHSLTFGTRSAFMARGSGAFNVRSLNY